MDQLPTIVPPAPQMDTCPVCHQPILSTYYFCPNCGTKLHGAPLTVSLGTELGVYAFSIILPMIAYLAITKWPGLTYLRSSDPKVKRIGAAACVLLVLSSVVTFYYGYVWTEEAIQQATLQVNQELNAE